MIIKMIQKNEMNDSFKYILNNCTNILNESNVDVNKKMI